MALDFAVKKFMAVERPANNPAVQVVLPDIQCSRCGIREEYNILKNGEQICRDCFKREEGQDGIE